MIQNPYCLQNYKQKTGINFIYSLIGKYIYIFKNLA